MQVIPSAVVPMDYLRTLNPKDLTTSYQVTLLVLAWATTVGTEVPHEMQLHAFLAIHNGHDSLVNTGTGSGKTLPIALNLLLDMTGRTRDSAVGNIPSANSKPQFLPGFPLMIHISGEPLEMRITLGTASSSNNCCRLQEPTQLSEVEAVAILKEAV